jgi:putative addiction module killer protein
MRELTYIIKEYVTNTDVRPYSNWLDSIKDPKTRAIIISHVDRMELGAFGDFKALGEGIYEQRIHYGPGYRIYYAKHGRKVYILLCGGNKSSQKKDIKLAKLYWKNFKAGD